MSLNTRDSSLMLNVTEAARRLGVSPRTIKRMHPSTLPVLRVGSRGDRRYSVESIDRYIVEHTTGLR